MMGRNSQTDRQKKHVEGIADLAGPETSLGRPRPRRRPPLDPTQPAVIVIDTRDTWILMEGRRDGGTAGTAGVDADSVESWPDAIVI